MLASLRCCLAAVVLTPALLAAQTGAADPARTDPRPDTAHPPGMGAVAIPSEGVRLNGILYRAAGAGNHPVAIFLHGYPGNEKNLDLAQAVRRAGYHALYLDYRGTWGTGGTFSFAHGLGDAEAALAWVRSPANAAKHRIDTRRLAIVGHSYGGWLALMTAAKQPAPLCVAAMAAWNVGWAGKRFAAHPAERTKARDYFRATTDSASGPVHGDAEAMVREMAEHANEWDYLALAPALRGHPVLLMAATRDSPDEDVAMHDSLRRALAAAGAGRVRMLTYEDDHPFSASRIAIAGDLIRWLRTDCAAAQSAR
jgi:pimeloyl-ACP methyl ester carboxylesterase